MSPGAVEPPASEHDIGATLVALLRGRDPRASICPSDVARALSDDEPTWRALMPAVRAVAAALADERCIVITQKDRQLTVEEMGNGPIRLRRGPRFPAG